MGLSSLKMENLAIRNQQVLHQGSLHRAASPKVEKAHVAALQKGSGQPQE